MGYFSVLSDFRRLRAAIVANALLAKYDPSQPRVPAGSPDGGQWTGSESNFSNTGEFSSSFSLAASRGRSVRYCMAQYAIDGLLCGSLSLAELRARCWAQANQRLGNCLAGRPIPPLSY